MIDWVTAIVPCFHNKPLSSGKLTKISSEGEVEWESLSSLSVIGSHDSSIRIKTHSVNDFGQGTHIYFDGNPVKFLQGHNLFGTNDLILLMSKALAKISSFSQLQLSPTDLDICSWRLGNFVLNRVDCTSMFDFGSLSTVLAWIRQAESSATLSHRGRGQITKGSTLYFGKNSRRSSLKIYAKGQEFRKNSHPAFQLLPSLLDYADRAIRFEVVLRSLELKHRGLNLASSWNEDLPFDIVNEFIGRLNMGDISAVTPQNIDSLTPSTRNIYLLWKSGHDIRAMYSRPTFYRHRKTIMDALGVDISSLQYKTDSTNVLPFIRIFDAKPMSVPHWAYGTSLYFDALSSF